MSNARIIEIPATRQIRSGKNNTMRKMRVAAYCRVSTEEEEQQGSFETQKLYYTEKINSTSEWELAGIYADATDIIGLKQNPTNGRRFSPIFLCIGHFSE